MDNFIEVYDDVVPFPLQEKIKHLIFKSHIPLFYTDNITHQNGSTFTPGFGCNFITKEKHVEYSFGLAEPLYYLSNSLQFFIEEIIQARVFVHLPSPNPGPDDIHTDLKIPHWVCLYYINDSDGDTILFKDDKKTEIKRIKPKQGRIVFFDGFIPHCSSRPALNTRAVLNFDFKGYKFGEEKKNTYIYNK